LQRGNFGDEESLGTSEKSLYLAGGIRGFWEATKIRVFEKKNHMAKQSEGGTGGGGGFEKDI